MAPSHRKGSRPRGGSGIGFALVLLVLVLLTLLIFGNIPALVVPPQIDPSSLLGTSRTNRPRSSAKEGVARQPPLYLDKTHYLPLITQ